MFELPQTTNVGWDFCYVSDKKKNGYTILNPANGIFGFRHHPCLPTVYN